MQAEIPRPDRLTLAAFGSVVVIGGFNFVAVKFSNQELSPFFGAAVRFAVASLLLYGLVVIEKIQLPRGRSLTGALLFGVLSFTVTYALAYWALLELPAAIAGVVMGGVPLLTLFLAFAHRLERFSLRGVLGALVTAAGIAILLNAPIGASFSAASLVAMIVAAVCAAESGVILKQFPQSHPLGMNAVAMSVGAALLFGVSAVANESWRLPKERSTWVALVYLFTIGSVGLFYLYLLVLKRWTASGASYQFVLFPVVAVTLGAIFFNERISVSTVLGTLVVIAGVYVGAITHHRKKGVPVPAENEGTEALAQRCPS